MSPLPPLPLHSFFYSQLKFSPIPISYSPAKYSTKMLCPISLYFDTTFKPIHFPSFGSDLNAIFLSHLLYCLFPSDSKLFLFNLVYLLRFIKDPPPRANFSANSKVFPTFYFLNPLFFYQQIGLKFEEETNKMLHLEHGFVWC